MSFKIVPRTSIAASFATRIQPRQQLARLSNKVRCCQCDFVCHVRLAHLCTTTAQALMSLFRETRGFEWKSKANWGSGLPCNQTWFGVSCDSSGNVISLSLPRNHLVGVIPSSLSGACALKTIHLHENSMFDDSIACAWMKLDSHTSPREQFSVERFLNLSRLSLWSR